VLQQASAAASQCCSKPVLQQASAANPSLNSICWLLVNQKKACQSQVAAKESDSD
jgi:hypothetical protein